MMPGALTSTRVRVTSVSGPLPSIGLPSAVDHPAQQAAADRHVDDGAGALDRVALADAAVVAEDHDADIVEFEVEGHALHAVRELDHLAGLDLVEAVDAGDAVADRQDLPDLGDIGLAAETGDLLLQDRRDFRRTNFHFYPFISPRHRRGSGRSGRRPCHRDALGQARGIDENDEVQKSGARPHRHPQTLQPAAQRRIDHARADLDDHAAEQCRIDADIDRHPGADGAAQLLGQRRAPCFVERLLRR